MKKRKNQKRGTRRKGTKRRTPLSGTSVALHLQAGELKRHLEKLTEDLTNSRERLEDAEIHINLLTRLITTLCIEKLGMRVGVLKRLLKRIEKEAIRDSQILHLESMYNLPHGSKKASPSPKMPKKDPWDDIS